MDILCHNAAFVVLGELACFLFPAQQMLGVPVIGAQSITLIPNIEVTHAVMIIEDGFPSNLCPRLQREQAID